MRTIDAVERRPFSLPISEIMDKNGDLTVLQNIKDKGYFNVEFQANKLTLVAGNYIGQIPLTSDITVRVAPKVPIGNLARIISLGNQPIKCLDYFRRTYQVQGKASKTLLEAIAISLITSLKELDAEGIFREYRPVEERLSGLRGRINIPEYIRDKLSKGSTSKLPCKFYELSADTLLNRTIKKAINKIGYALSIQSSTDKSILADLTYFSNRFGNVKNDEGLYLVSHVREYLLHIRLPILRQYYLSILDTSLIILEGSGVELQQDSLANQMNSFIVNLESAFENYIREVLRQHPKFNSPDRTILDGNREGKAYLFSDNKKYEAKPDLVIGTLDLVSVIGDVKYKTTLSEADRYQLISHAIAYGAKKAFFVTPLSENDNLTENYIGKIGDIQLYHYKINLDGDDLENRELDFQSWVELLSDKA